MEKDRRELWYYSMCLNCGAPAVRSLFATGTIMPCADCKLGFRVIVGKRESWTDAEGVQAERFHSAVVKAQGASELKGTGSSTPPATTTPGELSEQELSWLFGLGKKA